MPQSIARIYPNQETANAAIAELNAHGFKAHIVEGEAARIYAEHVQPGEVPVMVVDPPFGHAGEATKILESHNPVKVDLPHVGPTHDLKVDWLSATPLSTFLGWQVLSEDPTPLSTSLNQPVLKADSATSPTLRQIHDQSDHPAPISHLLRLPLLFERPGLLSAKFKWPLLSEDPAPLSAKFGWRMRSDDPTPVSTKFRWQVLLDNPAPLSSALGLKLLLT
jgi:hypothetical protein